MKRLKAFDRFRPVTIISDGRIDFYYKSIINEFLNYIGFGFIVLSEKHSDLINR